jgi:flavin reductase
MDDMTTTPDVLDGFRSAMRRMASSVSVVTTRTEAIHHGMAATSVSSLSFQPPSLLVCVNRSASVHPALVSAGRFCVVLLGEQHTAVCEAFGGRLQGEERFTVGDWREDEHGLNYLPDAPAALFCRLDHSFDYGTHTICIGQVEKVLLGEQAKPLLYHEGGVGGFQRF